MARRSHWNYRSTARDGTLFHQPERLRLPPDMHLNINHNLKSAAPRPNRSLKTQIGLAGALITGLLSAEAQPGSATARSTANPLPGKEHAWSTSASLSLKEAYDSNVYMQKVTPLANQDSFVTILTPAVSAQWKPDPLFALFVGYSPEIAFYHAEPSEDYITHRGTINLSGKIKDTTWELLNGISWIDGNKLSPTFFGPGGAPALGGVPLRDRRAAAIYRDGFKLVHPIDNWFLRPVVSAYSPAFITPNPPNPSSGVLH